jgi:hypothetical protein
MKTTVWQRVCNINEETWIVEMHIWCIETGMVLVLHFYHWVEASASGLFLRVFTCQKLSFSVLTFKHKHGNNQGKRKSYKFISKLKIISLTPSSIHRRIWLNLTALCLVFIGSFTVFRYISDFHLFSTLRITKVKVA